MPLPHTISCYTIILIIGLSLWGNTGLSQCNAPDQLPTNYCETAPLICLLNACYETIQDNFMDCCSGWCNGDYVIHNPQFFEMIATSTTIEIHLDVISCDDGTGLQGAIIGACPWATTLDYQDILVCNGETSDGYTMVLILDSAIVGNTYWFMIDGFSGSLCNYQVSYVSGIYNPPLEGVLDPDETMAIPDLVCQGYGEISVVANPPIGLAHGYIWITEWDNDTIFSTLPEITLDITDDMPPGIWDICIIPYSGCDTLEELCIPLEVVVVDDGLVEIFHCLNENFDPYIYEGEEYYSSGNYELFYPGQALAECDSMAMLQLTMAGVDAFIELTCSGNDFVLSPAIQEIAPANADVDWAWYESGSGFEITGDSILHTTEDGCYDLFATIEVPEGECTVLIGGASFCFDAGQYLPETPEVTSDTTICAQADVEFQVMNHPAGEQISYFWTAPPDVPGFQNDSSVVVMDFSNSTGGEVCVYANGPCGVSPTRCFNVTTVNPLIPPTLNCISTANSIFFDWSDVTGATGYELSLDHNVPFSVAVSEYLVQSLSPGTTIEMILTIQSPGPCASIIDSITCVALSCATPVIVLSGSDSVCINNGSIIQFNAQVNDSVGIGTWSGAGITDSVNGMFDPLIAGAGIHQITFNTVVDNCSFNSSVSVTVLDSLFADFTMIHETCVDEVVSVLYTGNASDTAIYDFDFDGATIISGSGDGPFYLTWQVPGIKTVSLQVTGQGCMSQVFTRQILVDRKLEPPTINCTGTDSTVLFSFVLDPYAYAHDINPITTQSYQSVNNTIEFFGLTPGEEVIIEFISFSNGPCPDRRDTFSCIARNCPMPIIVIEPVSDLCLYQGTGVVDLQVQVTGGTGAGTGEWSGPGVVDNVNGIFDPNIAGVGTHQIIYHFHDDGCDFNDHIIVEVYDPPEAIISYSSLMLTCAEPSLFLTGSGSTGGPMLFAWSTVNGVIDGDTNSSVIEVTQAGEYQLIVTNAVSGCGDTAKVTVSNEGEFIICYAGPDRTMTCDSTIMVLGGTASSGPAIIYEWTAAGGGHIIGESNGLSITVDAPGYYALTVIDTSTGCQAIDIVSVDIDTQIATIDLFVEDSIDCSSPTIIISATINEPVSGYTFHWSTFDGNITGPPDGSNVEVNRGGTYTLTIENQRNGCLTSADVFVHEVAGIIYGVDVQQRNVRCYGEANGELIVTGVSGGTPPFEFAWDNGGEDNTLTQLVPGSYSLTVTDQHGCSFAKVFTITEPAEIIVDIGPDLNVAVMDSVTIGLNTSLSAIETGSIEWGGVDDMQCPGCLGIQFIANMSTTVSVSITDTAGCVAMDSMKLTVIVPWSIYIPNIFSPNQDGVNDIFTIMPGAGIEISAIDGSIFDRWGNLIFQDTSLPFIWDGTFNNKNILPGVYVYKVHIRYIAGGVEREEYLQGDVTVIK